MSDDTKQPEKRSLVKKLCQVMAAVERVAKRGRNEFHKYDYVTEADLADAIRKELAERHLFIFPNVTKVTRSGLDVETMKWDDREKAKVPTIRKTQLTEIEVQWTFVDGESGEERTIIVHGVGEDNVDKGFYKAFTGSEKYMLMKSFLIPTGDDPEEDNKEEAKVAKESGKATAKALGQAKVTAIKQGVKTLFYTMPENHNGHMAEFLNVREYGSSLDEVAQEGLRQVLTNFGQKVTKEGTVLVPAERLQPLLEKLAGDCGITVRKLEAANA